jgi:ABC-type antimicrobial peptide transport system permease subunit
VTALVTMQHGILVLLGLTLGLPLAMVGGRAILATFSGDLFSFPFVVEAGTVAGTLAGVFLVAILAQWPALRRVSRASLAEAVRVRA